MKRAAISGSLATFVLIGAMTAIYGPLLPYLQTRYGISRTTAGGVLAADFGGSLAGVIWALRVVRRLGARTYLLIALATVAAGAVILAAASSWSLVLAGAAVAGAGIGVLDFGMNRLFALAFSEHRGAMLNLLNALFGVGAVLGPVIVALLARQHQRWLFGGAAILAVILAPLLASGLPRQPGKAEPPGTAEPPATAEPYRAPLSRTIALFTLAYLLYMGAEAGVSGWAASHLQALGYSPGFADASTAAFWLCLTAGRFLIIPVALRARPQTIVLAGMTASAITLTLALIPELAPVAYAATGLALAPVWPMGLAWLAGTAESAGATESAESAGTTEAGETHADPVSYPLAASMVGGAVFPYATGWIIEQAGVRATPAVLACFAVSTTIIFAKIHTRATLAEGQPR